MCTDDPCDNSFRFCLSVVGSSGCQYGDRYTGLVAQDNDMLTFGDTISANVSNPLIFNGTIWPTNVSTCYTVYILSYCI